MFKTIKKFILLIFLSNVAIVSADARIFSGVGAIGFGYATYKLLESMYEHKPHPNLPLPAELFCFVPYLFTGTFALFCAKHALRGN